MRRASSFRAGNAIIAALLLACSGSQKPEDKPKPDWDPMEMEKLGDGSESGGDGASSDHGSGSDKPAPLNRDKSPTQEGDYDLTVSDCRALADVYRGAWLGEEMEKLNAKKLKEKQFQQAEAQVKKSAEEAAENWYGACEGIAGSPFIHSRLKCATKSKTVQRFNDCWDGKIQE